MAGFYFRRKVNSSSNCIPARANIRGESLLSCVTSTPDAAETANIGAAGVDLGNGHLDAGN